jgi:hypothetical protein
VAHFEVERAVKKNNKSTLLTPLNTRIKKIPYFLKRALKEI